MKTITTVALLFLAAVTLAQTTPPAPTLASVSLTSEIGFTPLPLTQGKTPQTSPCASSPYTTDSQIYTVIVKLKPQTMSGAREFKQLPNVWVDDTNPKLFYLVTGNAGISQIKTSRRTYDAGFSNAAGEFVVPNLTWADASDILTELQKSPTAVTGLATNLSSSATLSLVPVTLPANTDMDDLMQELGKRGARYHSQSGWATAIQLLQANPPVLPGVAVQPPIKLTMPAAAGAVTTDLTTSIGYLQGLVNALGVHKATAQGTAGAALDPTIIFLVDSPCLTVELLPAVTGSNVTGGIVDFSAHYLFPFAKGNSFARFNVSGTSPLDRSATGASSTVTATFDAALNRDTQPTGTTGGPVRFTGGLTASYQRADVTGSMRSSKGSGGLKGSVSFPSVTQLTGNDTRPTLTFSAVGSTINTTGTSTGTVTGTSTDTPDTSQFEGNATLKAKFRWTPIFNSAIDGVYNISHDPIYGGRKTNYLINVDLLKFIVRDPLEFAATWKCGRPAPDYNRICGFYMGFSIASQQ